jgi:hypothetical protein
LKLGSDRLQQNSGVVETRLIASVRESEVRSEKGFIYSFISLDAVLHKPAISADYVIHTNISIIFAVDLLKIKA